MPCRDYYDDDPGVRYPTKLLDLMEQVAFAESALCQTLQAFIKEVGADNALALIDYKEAGIRREDLEVWFNDHLIKDADAKARARDREEKASLKKEALAKLTYAERQALGF